MKEQEYKPVSSMAIISLVGSIAGLVSFIAAPMLTIAIISLAIGAASFFQIRRRVMSGTKPAILSISLSIMTLIFAPIWHMHLFNSESFSGYIRIDLAAMGIEQFGKSDLDQYANNKICLKGYMVPTGKFRSLQTFQLSSNGDVTKPESTITITISTNLIDYRHAPMAVSGTLTVNPDAKDPAQRYFLTADSIRPCYSSRGLARRSGRRDC